MKIDLFEYLDFAGPSADVFQLGAKNGEYCWDGAVLTPKLTNPCENQAPNPHEADTNGDWKIGLFEFLDYAGPVADVFQLGANDGEYWWDGITLLPKGLEILRPN